jgi:hypothetical protein
MTRTFLYRYDHPEGKIFDTEPGRPDPLIPHDWKLTGWVEHRSELKMTRDDVIEAIVKQELARQPADRDKLEAEFRDKTGVSPHFAAREKTLIDVLDDNRAKERKRK